MFIVFLIKITSRSSFAVTKKREITKCYPSLDCLYLPVSDSVGIINTYLYYTRLFSLLQVFFYFSEQGNCSVFQLKRRTPSNPVRPAILGNYGRCCAVHANLQNPLHISTPESSTEPPYPQQSQHHCGAAG